MKAKEHLTQSKIIMAILAVATLALVVLILFSRNRIDPYILIDTGVQSDLAFYLVWSHTTQTKEIMEASSPHIEWLQSGRQQTLVTKEELAASTGQIEVLVVHPEFIPLRKKWAVDNTPKQLVLTPQRWQARLANRGGVTLQEVENHFQLVRDGWLVDGASKSSEVQQQRIAHLLNALLAAAPCGRNVSRPGCDDHNITAILEKATQYLKDINAVLQQATSHLLPELPQDAPAPAVVVPEN